MKRKVAIITIIPLTILALLAVFIETGMLDAAVTQFELDWVSVDAGGGDSSGGNFALSGTVGQSDAGTMSSGDDTFTLHGGFWQVAEPVSYEIYLPVLQR